MEKTLILGYGNADRQDDGVAWHVLARLARRLGRAAPLEIGESFEFEDLAPEFLFSLQLTPEMAEILADFDQICFVDAHTGSLPEDLRIVPLKAGFQNSPFTHHMTPETLLAFTETLYGSQPSAVLISIRGYEFGFTRRLSPETNALANQAVEYLLQWLQSP
jgi:hydrogenase maturation protease